MLPSITCVYLELMEAHPIAASTDEHDDKLVRKAVRADEFITAGEFFEKLDLHHNVFFGHEKPSVFHHEIEFNTKEQPAFNRQFDLLIRDLKSWEAKGFQLYFLRKIPNNWSACIPFLRT